jgi:RNA polymerase sigma-70 factor (ECF subfamily)
MTEIEDFQALIRKVRAGDKDATSEFVRTYEAAIRRAARIRILDPRLTPLLDSTDIVQSVFASFFVRAALGQYELEKPEQVLALLVSMSRKKLADHARKQAAARRDYRRTTPMHGRSRQPVAPDSDPFRQVATAELVEEFRKRMSPEENALAEQRARGEPWEAIASARGESAEALRKKLERAVNRIAQDLGLDEVADV